MPTARLRRDARWAAFLALTLSVTACSKNATVIVENGGANPLTGQIDGTDYSLAPGASTTAEIDLGRSLGTAEGEVTVTGEAQCKLPFTRVFTIKSGNTANVRIEEDAGTLTICNSTSERLDTFAWGCADAFPQGPPAGEMAIDECLDLKLSVGCWNVIVVGPTLFGGVVGVPVALCDSLSFTFIDPPGTDRIGEHTIVCERGDRSLLPSRFPISAGAESDIEPQFHVVDRYPATRP